MNIVLAAVERRAGRNIDNFSLALLLHIRKRGLCAQPRAAHIDRHRFVEFIHFHFPERALLHGHEVGGIVDQHVHAAELFDDFVDHQLYALLVRHIASHADRRAAHVSNGFNDVVGAGDIRQCHLGAFLGEPNRVGFADFPTAACDDHGFVLKTHMDTSMFKSEKSGEE